MQENNVKDKKNKPLLGKKILVGLTGSIACYKTCELLRMLSKAGASTKVVLSPSALEFVGIKTFETLTNGPVYYEQFARKQNTEHISLSDWADLLVIAPITANTISKIAVGIADNLITTVFNVHFGAKKPVIIAPAMNTGMYENQFVQKNINSLKNEGVKIVESEVGELACGTVGKGKMANVQKIYNEIVDFFNNKEGSGDLMLKKKILLTTGGTKEPIDPVRFISNESSGRMGLCLADFAHTLGYNVELISTVKIENRPYKIINVNSTLDMYEEVRKRFPEADYLIMAAAVADYRVQNPSTEKISKETSGETLKIKLVQNPDILKEMGKIKREGQKTIGFSLGTKDIIEMAKAKLTAKNADFIIANEAKTALNTDENEVWIIDKAQNIDHIEKSSKENVAKAILERVL